MRFILTAVWFACVAVPAAAAPSSLATASPPCIPRDATLGGIGRAAVVGFTGKVYGERVCVLVANVSGDSFAAQLGDAAPANALVSAALTPGSGAFLSASASGIAITAADAGGRGNGAAVGPFVVAPGGAFARFPDSDEAPRVVIAYAGARVVILGTSPVTLLDLAHALREQPDLFGIDAVERAVVISSGAGAAILVHADGGDLGSVVTTPQTLSIMKRS